MHGRQLIRGRGASFAVSDICFFGSDAGQVMACALRGSTFVLHIQKFALVRKISPVLALYRMTNAYTHWDVRACRSALAWKIDGCRFEVALRFAEPGSASK